MKFKKIIKNTIIFATMMLVIGVYTAPVISKAGDDVWYGASFDFDGDTYYTDRKSKNTLMLLMYLIILLMYRMDMNIILMLMKLILC